MQGPASAGFSFHTGHTDTKMLMRYTHLRAEDLVGRLGEHPMECTISGMCIIRKTLMTLAFGLFLVCASFGFFPPIVLPRWLTPVVHHEKVVRRTVKYSWVTLPSCNLVAKIR